MRGRKSGAEKVQKAVLGVLKDYPEGLPLRELSRLSGVPKSTLAYHLSRQLQQHVEETVINPKGRPLLRVIKLRG